MKFIKEDFLINEGDFYKSEEYLIINKQLRKAISAIVWPPGSDKFSINPTPIKKKNKVTAHSNGVVPIKDEFVKSLVDDDWLPEVKLGIAVRIKPGPIDLVKKIGNKYYAVEWETGNISSSHRALNKMAIGIGDGLLVGGTLVVPNRNLYKYLTDRVGNYEELLPYFPMYKLMKPENGILSVIVVEYDELDPNVPKIYMNTDGYGSGTEDPNNFRALREKRRKYDPKQSKLI